MLSSCSLLSVLFLFYFSLKCAINYVYTAKLFGHTFFLLEISEISFSIVGILFFETSALGWPECSFLCFWFVF